MLLRVVSCSEEEEEAEEGDQDSGSIRSRRATNNAFITWLAFGPLYRYRSVK